MERAVVQSRYTVGVLSPNYLRSNFTDFENVLAEHIGLEQSQRRFLGVMREDCKPRLGIRARYYLDMTDEDEFEAALARLVAQLRQSPDIERIEVERLVGVARTTAEALKRWADEASIAVQPGGDTWRSHRGTTSSSPTPTPTAPGSRATCSTPWRRPR